LGFGSQLEDHRQGRDARSTAFGSLGAKPDSFLAPKSKTKLLPNIPNTVKRRYTFSLPLTNPALLSITACKNLFHRFKRKKWLVLIRPLVAGFDSTADI
jgi:hypothetical protein